MYMTQVGFVGVGRMGANMARRLRDKGYRITAVQDVHQATSQALSRELGCEAARTPARVAELSDVILTVVSDDAAMREIYDADRSSGLLAFAEGDRKSVVRERV